jgi:RNA polymerase-interacting CarD/CdnL/TRCF family regulator
MPDEAFIGGIISQHPRIDGFQAPVLLSGWRFFLFSPPIEQEARMNFREGDPVVHRTYGFGEVIRLEERELSGQTTLYYAVQVRDLTIWVPADGNLKSRLRPPTPQARFKRLLAILSGPGEPLPEDRYERKTRLLEVLNDGRPESLCQVIRDLFAFRRVRALNENDQALLKRSQSALLGEWGFVLSVTPAQADLEMHRLLTPTAA